MKKNGFTLVELLTVVSLIGILTILLVPSFQDISDNIKTKSLQNKRDAITNTMLSYANKYLLDDIKPEGNNCSSNGCCKLYSVNYMINNGIYETEAMDGYVKIQYDTNKYRLTGEYVLEAVNGCVEVTL